MGTHVVFPLSLSHTHTRPEGLGRDPTIDDVIGWILMCDKKGVPQDARGNAPSHTRSNCQGRVIFIQTQFLLFMSPKLQGYHPYDVMSQPTSRIITHNYTL